MEDCICRKKTEFTEADRIFLNFKRLNNLTIRDPNKQRILPRIYFYLFIMDLITMILNFFFSPILFFYAKVETIYYVPCFKSNLLTMLIILLFVSIVLKSFIIGKLNSRKCCINRGIERYKEKVGDKYSKRIHKKLKKYMRIYYIIILLLIFFTCYIDYKIIFQYDFFHCSKVDMFGFAVGLSLLFSSLLGCLFNVFEIVLFHYYILNSFYSFQFCDIFRFGNYERPEFY